MLNNLQPQNSSQQILQTIGKRRIGDESEPSFMTERREGFNKNGKNFITRNQLQVKMSLLILGMQSCEIQ